MSSCFLHVDRYLSIKGIILSFKEREYVYYRYCTSARSRWIEPSVDGRAANSFSLVISFECGTYSTVPGAKVSQRLCGNNIDY